MPLDSVSIEIVILLFYIAIDKILLLAPLGIKILLGAQFLDSAVLSQVKIVAAIVCR